MSSHNEKQREQLIYGVWYEEDSGGSDERLVLGRESLLPNGWGQRYEFHENGRLIDAVSSPCGNQPGLHKWSGIWEIDREQDLITMKIKNVDSAGDSMWELNYPPQDYTRGREFLITDLTDQRMVLSESQSRA